MKDDKSPPNYGLRAVCPCCYKYYRWRKYGQSWVVGDNTLRPEICGLCAVRTRFQRDGSDIHAADVYD